MNPEHAKNILAKVKALMMGIDRAGAAVAARMQTHPPFSVISI
jgi:hypothetical protein